jgi:hypothetical protein
VTAICGAATSIARHRRYTIVCPYDQIGRQSN